MHNNLISILLPVKNTSAYLEECLISIVNQDISDWELLAVDDHSTDQSFEILIKYANLDKRIKVYKNNGKGIIAALRYGYSHSKGAYITRMDSDDIMVPNKLRTLRMAIDQSSGNALALGLVEYFSQDTLGEGYKKYAEWLNELTSSLSNFQDIYKECSIPSPCWMVMRSTLDNCSAFSPDVYPEDYDLAFRFKKAGLKIASVNEVIHRWRDYASRTSRTDDNYSDNRFTALKVRHFVDQDYDSTKTLYLWGAGNKGKAIAKHLVNDSIPFHWMCNNPKKIGKDIYGITLDNATMIHKAKTGQCIIAISSPKDQIDIKTMKAELPDLDYFHFC